MAGWEHHWRERAQRFLETLKTERPTVKSVEPKKQDLSSEAFGLLVKVHMQFWLTVMQTYEELGLTPAKGAKVLKELRDRGLVQTHRMERKGRGAQPLVVEVRSAGIALLEGKGIPGPRIAGKGKFVHRVWQEWAVRWARHQGYVRVQAEYTAGAKTFDVAWEDKEGKRYGLEIVLSGSKSWNSAQIRKAVGVAGIEQVIVACRRKEERALKARLEEDLPTEFGRRVVVQGLAEYAPV